MKGASGCRVQGSGPWSLGGVGLGPAGSLGDLRGAFWLGCIETSSTDQYTGCMGICRIT